MPNYVTKLDGSVEQADEARIELERLEIHAIVIRHGEVSFFDAEGRESVLVQGVTSPGGGMDVQLAEHVGVR